MEFMLLSMSQGENEYNSVIRKILKHRFSVGNNVITQFVKHLFVRPACGFLVGGFRAGGFRAVGKTFGQCEKKR